MNFIWFPMGAAFSSATLTILLWMALTIVIFLGVGMGLAWVIGRLIPKNQERLPRKHWIAGTVIVTFLIGLHAGFNVGLPQGMLAFGDSLVKRGEVIVLSPLPNTPSGQEFWTTVRNSYQRLQRAIDQERNWMKDEGIVQYALGHLILDQLYEPTLVVKEVGQKYMQLKRTNQLVSTQRLERAWVAARSNLNEVALRRIAASILIGALYMILLFVVGVLLLAISWRKMHASARRRREAQRHRRK